MLPEPQETKISGPPLVTRVPALQVTPHPSLRLILIRCKLRALPCQANMFKTVAEKLINPARVLYGTCPAWRGSTPEADK